eukprot:CAMPEP_0170630810 /NCGR_PEP_ID=MMETSP0224-20130122/34236_1 /TAXON_ID=285029 /ORGANISM="Togula jolla, Strain CCCM 725" /LENGTH=151 /DNA_ID=CAMNT_0010958967 /DNA_START=45 /DNA_END=500 /DNA_ORIENTATION=+
MDQSQTLGLAIAAVVFLFGMVLPVLSLRWPTQMAAMKDLAPLALCFYGCGFVAPEALHQVYHREAPWPWAIGMCTAAIVSALVAANGVQVMKSPAPDMHLGYLRIMYAAAIFGATSLFVVLHQMEAPTWSWMLYFTSVLVSLVYGLSNEVI